MSVIAAPPGAARGRTPLKRGKPAKRAYPQPAVTSSPRGVERNASTTSGLSLSRWWRPPGRRVTASVQGKPEGRPIEHLSLVFVRPRNALYIDGETPACRRKSLSKRGRSRKPTAFAISVIEA